MSETLDPLAAALADRYRIERELGAGGMATVFLAEDLKHHRKVAVKVLRPELAAILGAERFLKEIEVTANLHHPHILPLHDSGEADSFLYYVMPYVEGESLRDKLNREKQLGVEEAIRIAEHVASALNYAHRHDVIHRDIKPENILLHDDQALVADFGIALAVTTAGATRLTETGLSLGTPQYMSPEQATGERELTVRSDIYSLGAVTYEMLVGEPPHTGATVQAILTRVVSTPAEPITAVRPSVPAHVDAAVRKALAKVPGDRFSRASDCANALTNPALTVTTAATEGGIRRWIRPRMALAALITAGVATAGGAFILGTRSPRLDPDLVVVAPFANQSPVDSLDVLGTILADYLTIQIAETGIIQVVPSAIVREVMTADPGAEDTQVLAEATRAGTLISGIYFIEGDSLTIQAQITDVKGERLLSAVGPWRGAESTPMRAATAFAEQLLGNLALVMDPDAPPATLLGQPPSFEAYRDYAMALDLWLEADYGEALRLLYRALSVDSTFAAALVLAATTEWNATGNVARTDSLLQVAEAHRDQLAPLPTARLDWMRAWVAGDREAALRFGRRVMALHESLAFLRDATWANRPREAITFTMSGPRGLLDEPGMIWAWNDLTQARHMLGEHEDELREAGEARGLYPDAGAPLDFEIRAFAALGRVDDVRQRFNDILALQRDPGRFSMEGRWNPGSSLNAAALALRTHGNPAVALEAVELAADWYDGLPAQDHEALRYDRAQTLYILERWDDAHALIDSLRSEFPDSIDVLGLAGTLAARRTGHEEAIRISEALAADDTPYSFGRPTLWRARIAALLDDRQGAVALLTQSYEEGAQFGVRLLHDMDLEALRGYRPFDQFIEPKG